MRTIDSIVLASAEGGEFVYVVLVELAFPSGTIRAHNGIGTYVYAGNDYFGVGTFGGIETAPDKVDLSSAPIKLTLSSIDSDLITAVLADDIFGRAANIHLGLINEQQKLVAVEAD